MGKKAQVGFIAGLGMVAVLAGVLAVSLPRLIEPRPLPWPEATPSVPEGNRPVGPGSYTSIPEATTRIDAARPAAPVAPSGHSPVAPSSYTSIPGAGTLPEAPRAEPVAPDGHRPVAPGSYTTIPDGD